MAQTTNDQSASLKFLGNKADYPAADIGFQTISFDGNSQICYPKQNNNNKQKIKQKTTSSNQCSNTILHISVHSRTDGISSINGKNLTSDVGEGRVYMRKKGEEAREKQTDRWEKERHRGTERERVKGRQR